MAVTRRRSGGLAIELAVAALAFGGLVLGLCGLHVSRAEMDTKTADDEARQVTVFGIIATPGSKTADTNLATIKTQLDKLLPKHGFKLLDAQSKRIVAGESVTGDLATATRLWPRWFRPWMKTARSRFAVNSSKTKTVSSRHSSRLRRFSFFSASVHSKTDRNC